MGALPGSVCLPASGASGFASPSDRSLGRMFSLLNDVVGSAEVQLPQFYILYTLIAHCQVLLGAKGVAQRVRVGTLGASQVQPAGHVAKAVLFLISFCTNCARTLRLFGAGGKLKPLTLATLREQRLLGAADACSKDMMCRQTCQLDV